MSQDSTAVLQPLTQVTDQDFIFKKEKIFQIIKKYGWGDYSKIAKMVYNQCFVYQTHSPGKQSNLQGVYFQHLMNHLDIYRETPFSCHPQWAISMFLS